MSDNKLSKSGIASMRGYFYQIRYALYIVLKHINDGSFSKKGISVRIEGLDDIDVSEKEKLKQIFQTKNLTGKKELTNSNPDFWKTIRIWSEHITKGNVEPFNIDFVFIVNVLPKKGTIIDLLSNENKDIDKIIKEMNSFIGKTEINKGKKAFNSLTDSQKRNLLYSIKIPVLAPNMSELEEKIKELISAHTFPYHVDDFTKKLNSFWFQEIIEQISKEKTSPILAETVHKEILRLQKEHDENITHHFSDAQKIDKGEIEELVNDNAQFITQLEKIGLVLFEKAKQDFYKATKQRSKWLEQVESAPPTFSETEITNYENDLISEWETELESTYTGTKDEEKCQEIGREIYKTIFRKEILMRNSIKIKEKYYLRGSYHILADHFKPKVYWNPLYFELVKKDKS